MTIIPYYIRNIMISSLLEKKLQFVGKIFINLKSRKGQLSLTLTVAF